jgi:hypothetical protein
VGKKMEGTPRSRVRAALRQLWLRSRERNAALKAADRHCKSCGRKASVCKAHPLKVQVHHKAGIGNWEAVIDAVYKEILCDPSLLEVLCIGCHARLHMAKDDASNVSMKGA